MHSEFETMCEHARASISVPEIPLTVAVPQRPRSYGEELTYRSALPVRCRCRRRTNFMSRRIQRRKIFALSLATQRSRSKYPSFQAPATVEPPAADLARQSFSTW